ncbi:hypothetical protein B0A48_15377 [Cryoendolithus antarcticus]|uniref:FAD-binding PCMH-type domain-containing protein n=1 Tax=Cryoendolithus antarcticus TaxID=1507870 RepID=A0A1V8SIL6_9PEZI|nr:hypothetical protein B0A48_15377 [Cryoendolithus antarcticus]
MLASGLLAPLWLAAFVLARQLTPRDAKSNALYLDDIEPRDVNLKIISPAPDGRVPLFSWETTSIPPQQLSGTLQSKLGAVGQFLSIFEFADVDVSASKTTPPTYNLQGPGNCKVFPGDVKWPSPASWAALKLVTGGALLKPLPQASVCYANTGGSVSAAKCQAMAKSWTDPFAQLDDPLEMLSALYQGMTCQPPAIFNRTNTCLQGGYPTYVVKITNVAQIQLAINFARNTGIRLVIRNTGHDFSGKSGGAGALSIWTHHLKDVAYLPTYKDSSYTGSAIKVGVGVQGFELYAAMDKLSLVALGGECPTVGTAGGWIQGGGHSPVSSLWGMGADHALGFEVVTADGRLVTANKKMNPDLYWALRGGGGGTFGVVTSVIMRVHKDIPVTAVSWNYGTGPNVTAATFSAAFKDYLTTFPEGAKNGIYSYWNVFNFGGAMTFSMAPYFAAGKSLAETRALIEPHFTKLKSLGIPVTPKYTTFPGFHAAYNASFPVEAVNNKGIVTASRMFPKANWATPQAFNTMYTALWATIESGKAIIGYNISPTWARGGKQDTAVNPAWRTGIAYLITGFPHADLYASGAELLAERENFTRGTMESWRKLTPGSGAYLNEGDRIQPNFQWAFWGSHYPRLLEIKKRYDPFNLFYATTGVGSEFYEVRSETGYPDENGRLCVKARPEMYFAEGPEYVEGSEDA